MRKWLARATAVFVLLVCAGSAAYAQNAQVTGQVKDQTGGVLPGVTVSAKNQGNGLLRTDVTDTGGNYRLVALPPGTYTITTELQGFTNETRPNVALSIDQTATLNFSLKPASVSETITVTGEAPVVDVTRSDVATAMTTQQIQDLPVAARRWIDMAMLTPGTSQDQIRGQFYRGNVSIGAGVTNFYSSGNIVDGVNNTWAEQGEPRQNFPMDAIEEFKVSTSAYKAEYGLATGGVLNVVTKSGTNDLRFSGFLFYRDAAMTEKQYFQKTNPPYSRYQDGGSIGGPIVKDRLHYFFTFERTDENVYNTVTAPAWPQYAGTFQSAQYRWTYLGRLDEQLSHGQSVFFRFAKEYEYRPELTTGGVTTPSASFDFSVPRTSAVGGHTWVINERALNEFRLQYAFSKYEVAPPGSHGSWDAGYFGPDRLNYCTTAYSYPSISIGGCGNSQMGPEHRYEFKDDFSYQIKGHHQLKTGIDFSDLPFEEDAINLPLGRWTFPLDKPYDANNPSTWPTQYTQSLPNYANLPTKYYGAYVQDDWEIASGLTLNLGLRYDRQIGSFNEDVNQLMSYIGDKLGPQFATFPVQVPFINTSTRGDANNFGPRVGFAWDPAHDGRMNIHAAFGIYYDNMRTLVNAGELTWPQAQTIIINKPAFPDPLQGKSRSSFISTAPPNISVMQNDAQNPDSRSFNVGLTRSLTQELGLTADYTAVNRYHDRYDTVAIDLNLPDPVTHLRPYPQFGRVSELASQMNTTYRALLVKVDKRLSHHWSGLISYTLSSAHDLPVSNDLGGSYGFIRENGYSLADRRNKLVASGTLQLPWQMQVSAILDIRSSLPFNPATSRDINGDGYTADIPAGVGFRSGCRDMDLGAINAYRATFGLPAVSSVACPGYQDVDVRFSKSILMQGHRLELIAQLFNVTNRANFGVAVSNPLSSTFGQVNQIASYINAPSRQAELAVRYLF